MNKAATTAAASTATRRIHALLFGMLVTALAAISLAAAAQPAPPAGSGEHGHGGWAMRDGDRHHGMGMGHMQGDMGGHMGGGMMFGGSPERMGRAIDRMLDGLDASDAQRSQIKQIAAAAAADMRSQAEAGRALHMRAMQAFTAPNLDPAAVEQLRQQMLQQHDQMSRRMTQAMLDAARVLTPEQRARLGERMRDRQARKADRMKRMQERMQEHMHGMRERMQGGDGAASGTAPRR
jgi:Spy/CpxP family protein refolding chaperone